MKNLYQQLEYLNPRNERVGRPYHPKLNLIPWDKYRVYDLLENYRC